MARVKRSAETLATKDALSARLVALRTEFFGTRGAPEMARHLGLPVRSWYNYERGATVPGEVILRLIELTSAEPAWLLDGSGPQYRVPDVEPDLLVEPNISPATLIAAALELVENGGELGQPANGRPRKLPRLGRSPGRPKRT